MTVPASVSAGVGDGACAGGSVTVGAVPGSRTSWRACAGPTSGEATAARGSAPGSPSAPGSGSSTTKVLPTSATDSTVSAPPMRSHRCCESARPTPVPSIPVCSMPRRSKGTKTRSRSSKRMPWPVSATVRRSRPRAPLSHVTSTRPPGRLYFTAFDSRLSRTCVRRWRSATTTCSWRGSTDERMTTSARAAMGLVSSSASDTISSTRTGASVSSRYPDSMRAMSSTSSMRSRRWRPALRMWSTASACWAGMSSICRSWANPRMELRGVRSSWLMRDRKSLLALLAFSAESRDTCRRCSDSSLSVMSRDTTTAPAKWPSASRTAWARESTVTQCPSAWRAR